MEPHGPKRDQARDQLQRRLERLEEDPDVLASMPLDDVREALSEEDLAAVERLKSRFASPPPHGSTAPDRPAPPPARRQRWMPWVALAAAVLIVALGLAWWAGPGSLSETERLVALEEYAAAIDQAVDRPEVKAAGAGWAELEAGWAALRQARQQRLGFPSGYDDEAARRSIVHLDAAYRYGKSVEDGRINGGGAVIGAVPPQGLVAFLTAQAYLMLEDAERARFWLQTATGFDDEPWRTAAQRLLDRLPPAD